MTHRFLLPLLSCAALGACTSLGSVPTAKLGSATLRQTNGAPAGTVLVTAAGDRVTLNLAAAGLPEGTRGAHLHTVGRCDAPDFASAGGHLNPAARQHGVHNPAGSHFGDLPNLVISGSGTGALTVDLPGTRAEVEAALFDGDGTAIVVHGGPDDYKTDPSGNSGPRIACGVLNRG